jgi:hypothetical protein
MSATKHSHRSSRRPAGSQSGVAAVEFALLSLVFFTIVFGVIEVARLLFLFNTLQEVTRRAAAGAVRVYPKDAAAFNKVRQDAIFRSSDGELVLGSPITEQNVRIEYLALLRDNTGKLSFSKIPDGDLPSCAAQNRSICMGNPNADNCIRFVRVSICDASITAECRPVKSRMIVPLISMPVPLHKATTIATAESLGYVAGMAPCAPVPPSPP